MSIKQLENDIIYVTEELLELVDNGNGSRSYHDLIEDLLDCARMLKKAKQELGQDEEGF